MNHMDVDLYRVIYSDDVDVLKGNDLLTVLLDQLTPTKDTVLHLACRSQSIRCVREILRVKESLLLRSNLSGETALHLAAREGCTGIVKTLIKKAKVQKSNDLPSTSSTSTVLQNLIRAPNLELETALHLAVRHDHEKVVELLLKEDPSYSYPPNKFEETPLYLAAVRCHQAITRVILVNCDSPTYGGPDGRTALHAALMDENGYECMELLLEKNKDLIKVADNNGWTAFHYVAHNNLERFVEFLMKVDKSVAYLADKEKKRTPLHVAAYKGHREVLTKLLIYMPDAAESVDGNGQNLLHIAVMHHKQLFGYDYWADEMMSRLFFQRDIDGNTPLHLIAKLGIHYPLPRRNVDWDVVNNENFTPRDVLHQGTGTQSHEGLVGVILDRTQARGHWNQWLVEGTYLPTLHAANELDLKRYEAVASTHMIVAGLIATVALTAGFSMPGGFNQDGPNQGSPVLLTKTTFKTFMVADTIALLFSISSLFLYFLAPLWTHAETVRLCLVAAIYFNMVSVIAMIVAFIAGTASVLSHSSGLTITVCIISSLFFLLVVWISWIKCQSKDKDIEAGV